jgi:50S ribosomal subunit-associated GTPase HflX
LAAELAELSRQRQAAGTGAKRRTKTVVALVGYTNAASPRF